MTADSLLKRFDLVAATPGNIPRLRKLIVDLAVRGKLLAKTSGDALPEELLKRVAAKRESLIKAGKLRKQKPLLPITPEELPAAYSAHCVFERLGNVAILEKGLTGIQSAKRGEYPLVVTAEARSTCDHFDFEGAAAIIPMVSSSGHGDASLKRLHFQAGKFALGNILCAAFPISNDLISARFLYEYLTAFKEELLVSKMIGTANVSLTMGKIGDVPVPIVAPAVQQRVAELMGLCDALEAAQREREEVRTRLRTSALHQLASSDSDSKSAAFVLQNFCHFTTALEDLAGLRRAIMEAAFNGILTSHSGFSFSSTELPEGWALHDIASLCVIEDGDRGSAYPKKQDFSKSGHCIFLNTKNVRFHGFDFASQEWISKEKHQQLRKGTLVRGDIVFTSRGTIGNVAHYDESVPFEVMRINSGMFIMRNFEKKMEAAFLSRLLRAPQIRSQIDDLQSGSAQPQLPIREFRKFTAKIPPLAEQRRIVAKVDELMAVLDALEAALTAARTTSEKLLAATIAKLHAA